MRSYVEYKSFMLYREKLTSQEMPGKSFEWQSGQLLRVMDQSLRIPFKLSETVHGTLHLYEQDIHL